MLIGKSPWQYGRLFSATIVAVEADPEAGTLAIGVSMSGQKIAITKAVVHTFRGAHGTADVTLYAFKGANLWIEFDPHVAVTLANPDAYRLLGRGYQALAGYLRVGDVIPEMAVFYDSAENRRSWDKLKRSGAQSYPRGSHRFTFSVSTVSVATTRPTP